MYTHWHTPVKMLGQTFAFGEAESRGEAIAPRFEGDGAGVHDNDRNGGDGNPNGGVVDGDGMASSGNADSMRVNSVRLAGEAG